MAKKKVYTEKCKSREGEKRSKKTVSLTVKKEHTHIGTSAT